MKIDLVRVSTRDQHPLAREDALKAADCEEVFTDHASGVLARRPGLEKALLIARASDQLVVTKHDRFGRSLLNLIELAELLRDRQVDLVVLDQGVDTSTPVGGCFSPYSERLPSSSMS
ncbi:recombinase family protein [Rhodococcus sp. 14-2483-1-2]|uniref:recombinase family protein n=1 Tax=Rhodococcus sp. 14-2483-1-2 TaxID=2023147 RepID=UPI001BAE9F3F|nr:recombinase family protein [Rhodococcus sp. 14-2483-1-2]